MLFLVLSRHWYILMTLFVPITAVLLFFAFSCDWSLGVTFDYNVHRRLVCSSHAFDFSLCHIQVLFSVSYTSLVSSSRRRCMPNQWRQQRDVTSIFSLSPQANQQPNARCASQLITFCTFFYAAVPCVSFFNPLLRTSRRHFVPT